MSNTNALSVCLIVRNESQLLGECLDSVLTVANQIVVVDTGSIDETVDVAKRHGAEIYYFKWCDDFAAARNASIKYARGKWILWLDADERLETNSIKELNAIVQHSPTNCFYRVTLKNKTRENGYHQITTSHRLFPNNKGFRFEGKIHEHVMPPKNKTNFCEVHSGIVLHHLGYALSDEASARKELRNRQLLEEVAKEYPNDAMAHFNLAQHFDIYGRLKEAHEHYLKALGLVTSSSPMRAVIYNNLASLSVKKGEYEKAKFYAQKSIVEEPKQIGAYYHLYRVAYFTKNQVEIVTWLSKLKEVSNQLKDSIPSLPADLFMDKDKISFTLANVLYRQGKWSEARPILEELLDGKISKEEVLLLLADIALKEQDLKSAQFYLESLVKINPNHFPAQKILAKLLIKQGNFFAAINTYEYLLLHSPEDLEILRHLAGLYGIVGNQEKASALAALINGLRQ